MPLVQYMVHAIDGYATSVQDSEALVTDLLARIPWPENRVFCKAAVFGSFSLFRAALGVPCLLRLYSRNNRLDSLLIYLSRFFPSAIAATLRSQFEDFSKETKSSISPERANRYADLVALMSHSEIFVPVLHEWNTSSGDSTAEKDNLSKMILKFALLGSSGNASPFTTLIVNHFEHLGTLSNHILIASSQLSSEDSIESQFFIESLHTRFFEGLVDHISGKSSRLMACLHHILEWPLVEHYIAPERLNKWRQFESVATQFPVSSDAPASLYAIARHTVIIEKAKRQAPLYALNWENLKELFCAESSSSTTSAPYQNLSHWRLEHVENLLKNIWINLSQEKNEINFRIPLDWLLALIDQAPISVAQLAYVILEHAIDTNNEVKLLLFSPILLNFFSSLLKQPEEDNSSKKMTSIDSASMDIDISDAHIDGKDCNRKATKKEKLIFAKSLFRRLHPYRGICSSLIVDIISKLCSSRSDNDQAFDTKLPNLFPHRTQNSDSSSSSSSSSSMDYKSNGDMLVDVQPRQKSSKEEDLKIDLDSNASNLFENVRKRCREIESDDELNYSSSKKSFQANFSINAKFSSDSSSIAPSPSHLDMRSKLSKTSSMDYYSEMLGLAEKLSLPPNSSQEANPIAYTPLKASSSSREVKDTPRSGRTSSVAPGDLTSKLSETFVAEIDGRCPVLTAFDAYFEVLPKKPLFERNRVVEMIFLNRPICWSILDVISANPINLYSCRHIIMTQLTNYVGSWNAEPKTMIAGESFLISNTLALLRLLELVCCCGPNNNGQPSYVPLLQGVEDALVYCSASDVTILLLGVFRACVARLSAHASRSALGTPQNINQWILTPLRFILRRNVHVLASKTPFLYSRLFAASNTAPWISNSGLTNQGSIFANNSNVTGQQQASQNQQQSQNQQNQPKSQANMFHQQNFL